MRIFEKGHSTAKKKRQHLKDEVWLRVAFELSRLGTCHRRKVGAVFLDASGKVLSTGYNGVAPNDVHCIDKPCAGAHCASGTGLELCEAIHAEQNALAQCREHDKIHTVYSTDSPCMHCIKMLATTSAKRVVFAREYPHSASKQYWEARGGLWEYHPITFHHKEMKEATGALYGTYLFIWARKILDWVSVWRR